MATSMLSCKKLLYESDSHRLQSVQNMVDKSNLPVGFSSWLFRKAETPLRHNNYSENIRGITINKETSIGTRLCGIREMKLEEIDWPSDDDEEREQKSEEWNHTKDEFLSKTVSKEDEHLNSLIKRNAPVEQVFGEFFQTISREKQRLYVRDIEELIGMDKKLEIFQNQSTPEEEHERTAGVHTSMWYVGGFLACTPIHDEDLSQASANLLLHGGPKYWLVCDHRQRPEIVEKFYEKLQSVHQEKKICPRAIEHKIFIVFPQILNEMGIKYVLFRQNPGDLVITEVGALHFVFNGSRNLAEAINVPTPAWQAAVHIRQRACDCAESLSVNVKVVEDVYTKTVFTKQQHYCADCTTSYTSEKSYNAHLMEVHNTTLYRCDMCSKNYTTKGALKTHRKTHVEKECPICGLWRRDMTRHLLTHEPKKVCSTCKQRISIRRYNEHLSMCRLECKFCGRKCKSLSGVLKHEQTCKKKN